MLKKLKRNSTALLFKSVDHEFKLFQPKLEIAVNCRLLTDSNVA